MAERTSGCWPRCSRGSPCPSSPSRSGSAPARAGRSGRSRRRRAPSRRNGSTGFRRCRRAGSLNSTTRTARSTRCWPGLGERALVRETLGRSVPADVAKTLLSDGGELAPEQSEETVLWCMKWIEHRYEIILYWSAKKADADLNDGHAAATLDANLQPPTKSTGRPVFDAESRPSNRERLPSRAPRRVSRIRLSRVVKGPLD